MQFAFATFNGAVSFQDAVFRDIANFMGAKFCHSAFFDEVSFGTQTSFLSAEFHGDTSFEKAEFGRELEEAEIRMGLLSMEADGINSKVFEALIERHGSMSGEATFEGATFKGMTTFKEVRFNDEVSFDMVTFGGWVYFTAAEFADKTSFLRARFDGRAYFNGVPFLSRGTKFRDRTTFLAADFGDEANFEGAEFAGNLTSFEAVKFSGDTKFSSDAHFKSVTFSSTRILFKEAHFKERVSHLGSAANLIFSPHSWIEYDYCRIDKPELFTFNNVLLHPGWFLNADMRKVDFTDVRWYGMPGGPEGSLDEEIGFLIEKRNDINSPHTSIAQACRRLSANAEENREYPLANEFHHWSMNALRLGSWSVLYEVLLKEEVRRDIKEGKKRDVQFKDLQPRALDVRALLRNETWDHIRGRRRFGLVNGLYWALSGYGVRAARAFLVLLIICAVFAGLYMGLGPNALRVSSASNIGQVLAHTGQAVVYSLSTIARLDPEPKPDPGLFQFLVTIEGILGPLQIALLALAVRRKVMR